MGHARVNKGRIKGDDPQIDTAQTPKRFDRRLALQEKIQKTFADSIPNNALFVPEEGTSDSKAEKIECERELNDPSTPTTDSLG